jgi:CheY-like chemotaxis protein
MKPGLASTMETQQPFGIVLPQKSKSEYDSALEYLGEVELKEYEPRERIRILLVEHRFKFAHQLGHLMARWGHAYDIAYNSAAALQIADWHHPQVVIIDLDRPSKDASEMARRLKASLKASDVLCIGYTKIKGQEAWRNKPNSPFDLILSIPLRLSVLKSLLDLEKVHQTKCAVMDRGV